MARVAAEGSFPAPSRFWWVATSRYREADDEFWFLPWEVRESRPEGIELLFEEGPDAFVYVGPGSLAGFGLSSSASLGEADILLRHKLAEDVWLRLGGYEGWSLTIDDEERRGLSPPEALELVAQQVEKGAGELWLTRYQEDSLTVLLEPKRAFVMYLAAEGDSVTARDPRETDSPESARFTLSNGQVDEFSYAETLPKNEALPVVEHFLASGELASGIDWVAD